MTICVLDDEPLALHRSIKIIENVMPDAKVCGFENAAALFRHLEETDVYPDIIFSDIEMPGISGLDLAVHIKRVCPSCRIIFVTAYSKYAVDAFRLHVHGYILKPLNEERVREEIAYSLLSSSEDTVFDHEQKIVPSESATVITNAAPESNQQEGTAAPRLVVQCFGNFDVFWGGEPLMFHRRKTKELLAYLIDHRGHTCTSEEIAIALWEDEDDMKKLKARLRILISDLRHTLESIHMENAILRRSGQLAIRRESVDCDYYRMLDGDMDAVNQFHGDYIMQYSWAELTAGKLVFEY